MPSRRGYDPFGPARTEARCLTRLVEHGTRVEAMRDFTGFVCLMDAILDTIRWCAQQQRSPEIVSCVDHLDQLMETYGRSVRPTVQ